MGSHPTMRSMPGPVSTAVSVGALASSSGCGVCTTLLLQTVLDWALSRCRRLLSEPAHIPAKAGQRMQNFTPWQIRMSTGRWGTCSAAV